MKKRYFSPSYDFKTGFTYKICFIFAALFLLFIILLKVISVIFSNASEGVIGYLNELASSSFIDISIAFVILLLGVGVILFFFYKQFKKLADLVEEIEKEQIEE
jgi:uncharacterized membrane protein (DUF4010 family)